MTTQIIEGKEYYAVKSPRCEAEGVRCVFSEDLVCSRSIECNPGTGLSTAVVFFDQERYIKYAAARLTS